MVYSTCSADVIGLKSKLAGFVPGEETALEVGESGGNVTFGCHCNNVRQREGQT